MKKIIFYLFIFILICGHSFAQSKYPVKNVLIVNDGDYNLKNYATGVARQLGALLGHFNTNITYEGENQYHSKEIEKFDYIFYVGFSMTNSVPAKFVEDVMTTSKPVIWINSGFQESCKNHDIEKKFGALKYPSKKDKQAIQGNLFSYVDKTFYLSGKAHCHLNFSDSEETIRRT